MKYFSINVTDTLAYYNYIKTTSIRQFNESKNEMLGMGYRISDVQLTKCQLVIFMERGL